MPLALQGLTRRRSHGFSLLDHQTPGGLPECQLRQSAIPAAGSSGEDSGSHSEPVNTWNKKTNSITCPGDLTYPLKSP